MAFFIILLLTSTDDRTPVEMSRIARKTMRHIEEDSARRGAKAIRLDAFLGNPIALRLYSESGYRTAGSACWRKGPFVLLEKVLDAESR